MLGRNWMLDTFCADPGFGDDAKVMIYARAVGMVRGILSDVVPTPDLQIVAELRQMIEVLTEVQEGKHDDRIAERREGVRPPNQGRSEAADLLLSKEQGVLSATSCDVLALRRKRVVVDACHVCGRKLQNSDIARIEISEAEGDDIGGFRVHRKCLKHYFPLAEEEV